MIMLAARREHDHASDCFGLLSINGAQRYRIECEPGDFKYLTLTMDSLITGNSCTPLFSARILGRYDVSYFRCDDTGFIQTESPFWLDEAYSEAITALDLGLLGRNIEKTKFTSQLLHQITPADAAYLDYGGGYGIFTRLMRDEGFAFQMVEPHCTPVFARDYAVTEEEFLNSTYDCITAWEVFEHLSDPMSVIRKLSSRANHVLFSTVLVPNPTPQTVDDWWYFTPETGQHICFFSRKALEYIADLLGVYLYSDDVSNHLLTPNRYPRDLLCRRGFFDRIRRRTSSILALGRPASRASLRSADFESALAKLRSGREPGLPSGEEHAS